MSKSRTGHPVTKADLDALSQAIDAEDTLARDGIAYLRSLHPDRDYSDLSSEVLVQISRYRKDPKRFGHPNFLKWAAVFHKHIALHHYPKGEERIRFRYPSR